MALLPWKRTQPAAPLTSSFEVLALPMLPSLYNLAVWLTRNPADAEDLVQETFLKALRGFSSFEPNSNFKAWIFRILRNTHLTSVTGLAARRTVPFDDDLAPALDPHTPELNLLTLSDRAALQSALEALTPPLLEVILLADVEDMKYRDIASVLDIPIGTVMSRISRARAALRLTLAQGSR